MKNFTLKLILSAFLAGISSLVMATNYYAAPDAKDTGTGAFADPCTITNAWGKLSTAGDTLFLRGGIYYINAKQSINKIGTANARICIFAYPDETPILDFRGEIYGDPGISLSTSSSYMHIKGITIRYAGDNGIINQGNNTIIENCTFYGNCDTGLQHKTGGGNLIKNCDSYANFDYKSVNTDLTPNYGGNADGFADKQFTNTNSNTYEGCRAWNNSDDAWDFFQRIGHTYLKNCVSYKNGPATYDMSNHPRATTDAAWFANFSAAQLAAYTNYGNGNGFKLGGDYTSHDATLTNCLSVGHKKTSAVRGYDQNNNAGSITIYNCSAYDNSVNFGFYNTTATDGSGNTADLTIKNCVALTSSSANTYPSNLTSSNNSWNTTGVTLNTADFISMDTTVILSARQADGSLPNIVFMQIADGSDLIDAGTNVGLPYSGTAPDLGCFEKGTLDNFPGAVNTPTNASQTVVQGNTITPIVFTWSAGATGLSVTGLPAGITTTVDNTAKTLTLSGAPTEAGVFNYTVTTVGGTGTPASVSGKIVSGSASAKKIAYFTTLPTTAPDAVILNKLQANIDFLVTPVDATSTTTDYSGYDLVVMSPVPASSAKGFPVLETLNKPMLLFKPFALKSSVWDWGTANNLALTYTTVSNKTHAIFTGLTFTGTNSDQLELFSSVSTNSITGVSAWTSSPSVVSLAKATGTEVGKTSTITVDNIAEVPVGSNMNGTTTTQRFLMIGLSEYSTANLTATATQLIENSCYYLMGMSVPASSTNAQSLEFKIKQDQNSITIISNETIEQLDLYSISGVKLASGIGNQINTNNITQGAYIIKVSGKEKQVYKKVIIK